MCPSSQGADPHSQGLQEERASARPVCLPEQLPHPLHRGMGDRRLGVSSGGVWVHLKHTHWLLFLEEAYGPLMENVESIEKRKEVTLPRQR